VPIYDLGYRGWQGRLVPEAGRFWAITTTGIRLAWQSKLLRRLLLVAWLPTAYVAVGLFMYEQLQLADPRSQRAAQEVLENLIPVNPLALSRHGVWSWLLSIFLRYPQGVIMVLVVGLIAPPLVAQDVRTRAFLLYFSRPVARAEYVLGKMAVLWAYLALITMVPALFLYWLGVFLSPQLSVVGHTWDLPLRILAASAVLMIPTAALALAVSSLTSESRYATFAWFAIWAIGWVTYAVVEARTVSFPAGYRTPEQAALVQRVSLASLYHTVGRVQHWIFGLEGGFTKVSAAAIELTAITVISLAVVFRRVSSPMRI
jgi:hypothetical protein